MNEEVKKEEVKKEEVKKEIVTHFVITTQLGDALVAYLQERPYKEVSSMIIGLKQAFEHQRVMQYNEGFKNGKGSAKTDSTESSGDES
jgi:hypothetical protein